MLWATCMHCRVSLQVLLAGLCAICTAIMKGLVIACSAVRGPVLLSVGETVLVVCMSGPSARGTLLHVTMTDGDDAVGNRLA